MSGGLPRFWVADADGSNKVYLVGEEMPIPPPTPVHVTRGSDHTFLRGKQAPGLTERQDMGPDPNGVLRATCKKVLPATRSGLMTKYLGYANGQRPKVRVGYDTLPGFTYSGVSWLCTWVNLESPHRGKRQESYSLAAEWRIEPEEDD